MLRTIIFSVLLGGVVGSCGGSGPGPAEPDNKPAADPSTATSSAAKQPAPVELLNAHEHDGYLLGGQPKQAQLAQAKQAGYTTVINLQAEEEDGVAEERARTDRLGLRYVAIPIASAEDLTRENAERLAEALKTAGGPTIVHCRSGNRVGALFALKAHYVDGRPADESVHIGIEAGLTSLEDAVRTVLGLK